MLVIFIQYNMTFFFYKIYYKSFLNNILKNRVLLGCIYIHEKVFALVGTHPASKSWTQQIRNQYALNK